jgi:hypothetical protein
MIVVNMETVIVKREAADLSETLVTTERNAAVHSSADHTLTYLWICLYVTVTFSYEFF